MRPWGHLGLVFTQGLAWSIFGALIISDITSHLLFLGTYLTLRIAMVWSVGSWGLGRSGLVKKLPLIIAWDLIAFALWVVSFSRKTVTWRGGEYYIRDGMLVPAASSAS